MIGALEVIGSPKRSFCEEGGYMIANRVMI